jgi:hypothetical protein
MGDLERDDPNFVEDLKNSHAATLTAAEFLQARGFHVEVNPLAVRPTVEERHKYSDNGDLWATRIEDRKRIEVKHRGFDFTCADDFPHKSGLFVDEARLWDRANPKPTAYIIMNRKQTVAVIVTADTSDKWRLVERLDREKHRVRKFYECPLDAVKFFRLRESVNG